MSEGLIAEIEAHLRRVAAIDVDSFDAELSVFLTEVVGPYLDEAARRLEHDDGEPAHRDGVRRVAAAVAQLAAVLEVPEAKENRS